METKMLVVCVCGVRLRVSMAKYLQMRCPKCQTMLAEEIERQASRNSLAVWDLTSYLAHERMNAKKWHITEEVIARLLAKHEIESHGGEWPPKMEVKEEVLSIEMDDRTHQVVSPLATPPEPVKKISIKLKKKGKRGRR